MSLRLRWRLNSEDEKYEVIEDEALLTGDILTPLLQRDPDYEQKYILKAKPLVVEIYQQRLAGERDRFPKGFFTGRQGEINLGIIIRYLIEQQYGWKVDERLPEKVTNWAQWFRDNKLGGVLNKYQGSPLKLMKIAYPENFWNPYNWEKPFLWFPHQFAPKNFWSDPLNGDYIRQLIRYMIEVREGWTVDEQLPSKVTQLWLRKIGLGGLLKSFGFDHISLLQFAYREEFSRGLLSPRGFKNLRPGLGVASVYHPPKEINPATKTRKIDGVFYYFGKEYTGWLVGKLSYDYGGVFSPDGELRYIFPLVKPPDSSYINVPHQNLLWEIPDFLYRVRSRVDLPLEENLRIFKDALGISPLNFTLREQIALAAVIESQGIEAIERYYRLLGEAGEGWLRALANLSDYRTGFEILTQYDLEFCKRLCINYASIYTLIQNIKTLVTFPPRYITNSEDFHPVFTGDLAALGNALAEFLLQLNNYSLTSDENPEKYQEELLTFLAVLREYLKPDGNIILSQHKQEGPETSLNRFVVIPLEYSFARSLTVRTRRREEGHPAGIFFTIREPDGGSVQFFIQRSFSNSRGNYVVKFSFQGEYFREGTHFAILKPYNHYIRLAQEEIFANLIAALQR
jgi:hypothetical protein